MKIIKCNTFFTINYLQAIVQAITWIEIDSSMKWIVELLSLIFTE